MKGQFWEPMKWAAAPSSPEEVWFLSPGIGAQGGDLEAAPRRKNVPGVRVGCDYAPYGGPESGLVWAQFGLYAGFELGCFRVPGT